MRRRWPAGAVIALVALAACSASGPAADLDGRTFVSTDVQGYELVDGTPVRITFRDGDLSASASCNTMSGAVSIADSRLRLDEGLMITEMGCHPPQLHEQEQWLARLLGSQPIIEIDGGTLVIEGEGTVLTLNEEPEPTRS